MTNFPSRAIFSAFVLFLWRVEIVTEACSCSPVHPQEAYCNADVVIRAKVVNGKEVELGNDVYGNPIKKIRYEVKQNKMFKGPDRDIEAVFTSPLSSLCGVTLDHNNKKEYLIAGKRGADGEMQVNLCDLVIPWESLSATQKKSIGQRYEMGCDCKITSCSFMPCTVTSHNECLWTDWVLDKSMSGDQANHYTCVKRSDGSCAWYRGMPLPKQEFLDIEDP